MNPDTLRRGKAAMNVLWVVFAMSLVLPASPLVSLLRAAFAITLAAHLLEFAIFYRRLSARDGTLGHHFVQVLLYGFLHVQLAGSDASAAR